MLKPTDKIHVRSKMFQIGAMCCGYREYGCYRSMKDEDSGIAFCMMMYPIGGKLAFVVHESDEYMHLMFEDKMPEGYVHQEGRYYELSEHGNIELPQEITDSAAYKRVYAQIRAAMIKLMVKHGFTVNEEDMTYRFEPQNAK